MEETYSILLVEDDDEMRAHLLELFTHHPGFEPVHVADTVKQGVELLEQHKPDILLTDLGLPDGEGSEVIKAIAAAKLDTQAMVLSGFQDEHRVFDALQAGACGYIHKQDRQQEIVDAVSMMMDGGSPISPVIARLMLKRFQPAQPAPTTPQLPETLTERETRILRLVSQGFSSREIGEKLDISYYTVTTHIKNIYGKLQVNSRAEAINEAYKLGLME